MHTLQSSHSSLSLSLLSALEGFLHPDWLCAPLAGKLPGKAADYLADIDAPRDSSSSERARERGGGRERERDGCRLMLQHCDAHNFKRATATGPRHQSEVRLKMCKSMWRAGGGRAGAGAVAMAGGEAYGWCT